MKPGGPFPFLAATTVTGPAGIQLDDVPALRRAAYGLAGCAMRGELSLGRGPRAAGIILVTEGAVTVVLGIVLAAAVGGLAAVAAIIPFAWAPGGW